MNSIFANISLENLKDTKNSNSLLKLYTAISIGLGLSSVLNASYHVETIAGTGVAGFSGDGTSATAAQLNNPGGICVDSTGNIYIADSGNNRIRKFTEGGNISTIAGGVVAPLGDGGLATAAQLMSPQKVFVDNANNIYVADTANHRIRKFTESGNISTIAGYGTAGFTGDGAAATAAQLNNPGGIWADNMGNIYVADTLNNRIRKFTEGGNISTIAGDGTMPMPMGGIGDGGLATTAQLMSPQKVFVDNANNIYVADTVNHRIRKFTEGGNISTIAGIGGQPGFSGDGAAAVTARLAMPAGICMDSTGNIYIVDSGNNCIRKIDTNGTITTIAGLSGVTGTGFSDGAGSVARFNSPSDIVVDAEGNIYVVDRGNNRIRKIFWVAAANNVLLEQVTPAPRISEVATAAHSAISEATAAAGEESGGGTTGDTSSGDDEAFRFALSPQRIRLNMGVSSTLSSVSNTPYAKALHALEKNLGAAKAMRKISDNITIWASGVYAQGQMKQMYGNPASAQKHYGVILGGHYHHKPTNQHIGLAFDIGLGDSFVNSNHDMKNTYHSSQATLYYGISFAKNWKLNLRGSFMTNKASHRRPYNNNSNIALAHSKAHVSSGATDLAYKFKFTHYVHVTPSVGFNYTYTKQFAYQENNAGSNNQFFPAATMNESSIRFGLKGEFFYKADENKTYGIYPQIGYTRYVQMGSMQQRVITLGSGQSQLMQSGTPGKDLVSVGIGAGMQNLENATKTQLGYTANFQKYKRSHEVSLKHSIEF